MARYEWKAKVVGFDPVVRTNRCTNPSFETNANDWQGGNASVARDTSIALYGTASLRATPTLNNNQVYAEFGTNSTNRAVAAPGEVWTASVYIRSGLSGNPSRTAAISVSYYTAGGSSLGGTLQVFNISANGWTRLVATATAPANTARVGFQVRFQYSNISSSNVAYLDGALLEKTSFVKPYFDGSTTGPLPNERNNVFAWTGTANNSTSTNTCEEAEASGSAASLYPVTSVSISRGRQQVQDPFRAATATVTGRDPQFLPSIRVGDVIQLSVFNPALQEIVMFYGYIADLNISYGEVPAADTWTIYCEDALAAAGRAQTSSSFSWSTGISTFDAAKLACTDAGIPITDIFNTASGSTVSAQSLFDTNLLTILQTLVQTEQGRLISLSDTSLGWIDRTALENSTQVVKFTDDPATYTGVKYTQAEFRSLADSFYESVTVEPQGLAAQTAGVGTRQYSMNSYDETTAQASNLAGYVLATLQSNVAAPSIISTISELQTNDDVLLAARDAGTGERCGLLLRGYLYDLFIEGVTISANPDQTRFTFNVVSADALNFFILDSSTFGVLDTNKLGF